MRLNLQHFAEPNPEGTGTPPEGTPPEGRTFTQADLDAVINRKYAKWQEESKAEMKRVLAEAQKTAKMTAEEQLEHQRAEQEAKLKERETEVTRKELRAQALELLGEKGLPKELIDILPFDDEASTTAALTSVEKVFRSAVDKAVKAQLGGEPPKKGAAGTGGKTGEREKLIEQYNEAEKKGDSIRMLALDAQIKKLPKE